MSNSSMVSCVIWSPNCNSPRNHRIDRITPHCVVGQASVESLGELFANPGRQASSNYGIGFDGRVGLYCDEGNRSWCSSSAYNDNRAITIECASENYHPYAMHEVVFNTLVDLCADICKRNGKNRVLWLGHDNYEPQDNEMLFTLHRWYADTICPGDWLVGRMSELADKVNAKLNSGWVEYRDGDWWYVKDGKIDKTFTGVAPNENGWWYCYKGKVDFNYTGLAKNDNGWWYCKNGKVDFTFNGLCQLGKSWWLVKFGAVDFSFTGLYKNPVDKAWWYVVKGQIDFSYTGLVKNGSDYWKVVKNKVDSDYFGLGQNEKGAWMYFEAGKFIPDHFGLVPNKNGTWVVQKGLVDFDFNGKYHYSGVDFKVKNGKIS